MGRPRRQATRHPDRPHRALGYCDRCYSRLYLRTKSKERRETWAKWANEPENRARLREYAKDRYHALFKEGQPRHDEALNRRLRATFGITLVQYRELLAKQNGNCAICRRPETSQWRGQVRRLGVDHAHSDGRIRGLLCAACNTMVGLSGDDSERLEAAAAYLRVS